MPYVVSYSDFDGDKIIQTKTYIDFGIFVGDYPIGLFLANIESFHYNGNVLDYKTRLSTSDFDSKNREVFSLHEKTYDNGETWIGDYRDSTIYDSSNPMYLGFANRIVNEILESEGNWKLYSTNIFTDCGSIPDNTIEVNKLNFDARFVNESIIIDSSDFGTGNVKIQLVDIQGRIIFQKDFDEVPFIIHTCGLSEEVYVLTINTKDGFGTKKLIKN